ncbi:MAG: hypothetical protein ACFFE8_15835 [Candidatus Heimdallarchaeota archaeon]
MQIEAFKRYLKEKNLDPEKIHNSIALLREFRKHIMNSTEYLDNITYEALHDFSAYLIKSGKNSYENYVSLLRYGYFTGNKDMIIATMELLDGSEMIENFSKRLIEEYGEEVRNEIFKGVEIPPLGLHPKKKPLITKVLVKRFLERFGDLESSRFFANGLRNRYTESYKKPRETFQESQNIDEFLRKKRKKFLKTLESHFHENSLFFTQEVDSSVINYVNSDPTIESGIRTGNKITVTKIPYMTAPFLKSNEDRQKRYYFCHNPWIREALLEEDKPISPIFCNCSGGFYKNYWEAVLDQHPIKVELLESVIKGDTVCRFAVHLPKEILDKNLD